MRWTGTKEIKVFVKNWITQNQTILKNKIAIDVPAGNGYSTKLLLEAGAQVKSFDLFPDFFKVPGRTCSFADLGERIPLLDESADFILCQEGIEHLPDPIKAFSEFNRVLKVNGTLVITTPNYSNLRSRLSYMLTESEYFGKIAAPNEFDGIWFTNEKSSQNAKLYFGHVFLIGLQRLRLFSKVSGFEISQIYPTRVNTTSLLLFPFFYPFILIFNLQAYFRMKKKHGRASANVAKTIFFQGVSPKVLLDNHLFVIFHKTLDVATSQKNLQKNLSSETYIT